MATTTPTTTHGTPLSIHDCPGCGAPISLRQEAIGEALLKLAAATNDDLGYGIFGDCTPLYCIACLEPMLGDDRLVELARLKVLITRLGSILA